MPALNVATNVMSPTNGTSVRKSTVGSPFEARWKLWIAERSWTTIVYVPAARLRIFLPPEVRFGHRLGGAARRARREGEDGEGGGGGNEGGDSVHVQPG